MNSLDGIRGVAVLVVVAFHSGLAQAPGGFIGVDIFFVLSGFLITGLLVREAAANGQISLVGFWFRRARRLVPAAILTIVGAAVLFSLVAAQPERTAVLDDGRAASLWYANWHFLSEAQDYFAADIDSSPFLHFWSLSIEEQFYAAWPLVVFAVIRTAWLRQILRSTPAVVAVPIVAAIYSVLRSAADPTGSYYATDTRVYQLLAGAALAVVLVRNNASQPITSSGLASRVQRWSAPVMFLELVVAAGVLAWLVIDAGLSQQARGLAATGLTLALIARLAPTSPFHVRNSAVERVLSIVPLVQVGRISYGVYLWHWPIIVWLTRSFAIGSTTLFSFALLGSLACAAASWMFVEQPIQRWSSNIRRPKVQFVGVLGAVAMSIAVAFVALPIAVSERVPFLQAASRAGFSSAEGPTREIVEIPVPDDLGRTLVEPFEFGDTCWNTGDLRAGCSTLAGGAPVVLLLGDSHAGDVVPALSMLAASRGFTLHSVITAGCPWQRSLEYVDFDSTTCRAAQNSVYDELLDQVQPDLILAVSHPQGELGFRVRSRASAGADLDVAGAEFAAATAQSAQDLAGSDAKVVIIEPRPSSPFDPVNCLAAVSWIDECAFTAGSEARAESAALRDVAQQLADVSTVSIEDLVCPRYPLCDAIIAGTLVRYDKDHLYEGFAQSIADELWSRITAAAAAD